MDFTLLRKKPFKILSMCIVLLIMLVGLFALAGCGEEAAEPIEEPVEEPEEEVAEPDEAADDTWDDEFLQEAMAGQNMVYATVGPPSGYYNKGLLLSQLLEDNFDMTFTPQTVQGTVAQLEAVKAGEAQLCPTSSYDAAHSYQGLEQWEDDPYTWLRIIQSGYNNYFAFLVDEGSGIETWEDLKGKRVLWDIVGSGSTQKLARAMLEYHDIDVDEDIISVSAEHVTDAIVELAEGRVDATIYTIMDAGIEEQSHRLDPVALPIDEEMVAGVGEMIEGFLYYEYPRTVHTIEEGTGSIGMTLMYIAHEDIPDEVVYAIVKTMIENYDEVVEPFDPTIALYSPDRAVRPHGAPYHPGAVKYYKEAGLWSDEMEQLQQELLAMW